MRSVHDERGHLRLAQAACAIARGEHRSALPQRPHRVVRPLYQADCTGRTTVEVSCRRQTDRFNRGPCRHRELLIEMIKAGEPCS